MQQNKKVIHCVHTLKASFIFYVISHSFILIPSFKHIIIGVLILAIITIITIILITVINPFIQIVEGS